MQKAIAIDFDGCLCTNEYPKIGKPILHVIDEAKKQQAKGAGLILWTCREGKLRKKPWRPVKSGGCISMRSTKVCLPGSRRGATIPARSGQMNTGMIVL